MFSVDIDVLPENELITTWPVTFKICRFPDKGMYELTMHQVLLKCIEGRLACNNIEDNGHEIAIDTIVSIHLEVFTC